MRKPTKSQLNIIRMHAKDTADHFKNDKWDLDSYGTMEYLFYDLLGFHASDVFKRELIKKCKFPLYLKFVEKRLTLSLKKDKKCSLDLSKVYRKKRGKRA